MLALSFRAAQMNKHMKKKVFQQGDKVLIYNSKLGKFPGKLKLRYSGPFLIHQDLGQGLFQLKDLTGQLIVKPINGFRMKKFREGTPTSEWFNADVTSCLVSVNLMIPCMDLCALTHNFSNFENKTGLELFSREDIRIIKGFGILACAKSFVTWNDSQFKNVALFMQSPTSSGSTERTESAMKTQCSVKEQGTSRRSVRGDCRVQLGV